MNNIKKSFSFLLFFLFMTSFSHAAPAVSHGALTQTGYTVSFTDSSTDIDDTGNLDIVTVDWRDGSTSTGGRNSVFTHTYSGPRRSYSIKHMITDATNSTLYSKEPIRVAVPLRYAVMGTVFADDGITPIANARVYLKQGIHRKVKKTNSDGAFSFVNTPPGDYTIQVIKTGANFGADAGVTVVGANVTQDITQISGSQTGTFTVPGTGGGTVTLAWDAPTTNTDGSALNPVTNISQYEIYYGKAPLAYTTTVTVANPGTTTISETLNLSPGTYYFAVAAVASSGQESGYSDEIAKTL